MDDQNTPPLPSTNTPPLPEKDGVSVPTTPIVNDDVPPAPSDVKSPSIPMPPAGTAPTPSAQPTPAPIADDTPPISTPTPLPTNSTITPINSGAPISPPTPSDIAALPKIPTEKIGDQVNSPKEPLKNDLSAGNSSSGIDLPAPISPSIIPPAQEPQTADEKEIKEDGEKEISPPEKDDMPVEESFPGQPLPADKMEDLEKKAEKLIEDEGGIKDRKVKVLGKPKKSVMKNIVAVMALMILGTGVFVGQKLVLSEDGTDNRSLAAKAVRCGERSRTECNGCFNGNECVWRSSLGECKAQTSKACKGSDDSVGGDSGEFGSMKIGSDTIVTCGSVPTTGCSGNQCLNLDYTGKSCNTDKGKCWKVSECEDGGCLDGVCGKRQPVGDDVDECSSYSTSGDAGKTACDDADDCHLSIWYDGGSEKRACKPDIDSCTAAGWEKIKDGLCCPTSGPDKCTNPGSFTCIDDPYVSECVPVSQSHIPNECANYGTEYVWKIVKYYKDSQDLWADPRCSETPPKKPPSTPTPPPSSSLSCTGLSFTPRQPDLGEYVTVTCNGAGTGGKIVDHYDFQYKTGVADWVTLAESGSKGVSNRFQVIEPGGYSMRCRACEVDGSCTNWQTI